MRSRGRTLSFGRRAASRQCQVRRKSAALAVAQRRRAAVWRGLNLRRRSAASHSVRISRERHGRAERGRPDGRRAGRADNRRSNDLDLGTAILGRLTHRYDRKAPLSGRAARPARPQRPLRPGRPSHDGWEPPSVERRGRRSRSTRQELNESSPRRDQTHAVVFPSSRRFSSRARPPLP